jgi:hypothetical protein
MNAVEVEEQLADAGRDIESVRPRCEIRDLTGVVCGLGRTVAPHIA